MQNEQYYLDLIISYYEVECTHALKKKYGVKTFKEVYAELDLREKEVLRLQSLVLEQSNIKEALKRCFCKRKDLKNSINLFKIKLFSIDTGKEINFRTYRVCKEVLNFLENKSVRKQSYLEI